MNGNKKLILLVEDNLAHQQLALRQLQQLGYTAHAVSNGREAVEAIQRAANAYRLVLMDCRTPEMDGFTATRIIRQFEKPHRRHIPIVALTANAMSGDHDACLAAGMDDYISKPVSLERLRSVLEKWLPATALALSIEDNLWSEPAEDDLLDRAVIASLRVLQEAGEPAFLSELIALYFEDVPRYFHTMHMALAQQDLSLVSESAHSLKGSSASIGARTIAALCQQVEDLSRSGVCDGLAELLKRTETEFVHVKAALEAERDGKQ